MPWFHIPNILKETHHTSLKLVNNILISLFGPLITQRTIYLKDQSQLANKTLVSVVTENCLKRFCIFMPLCVTFDDLSIFSYFWGWLSDRKGRKPIVVLTVLLIGLSSIIFGFTTNLYFAFCTRLLAGLVNGKCLIKNMRISYQKQQPKPNCTLYIINTHCI